MFDTWLPYPLTWLKNHRFVNCIGYPDGSNDHFVFLRQGGSNNKIYGVRSVQALNGRWVYWELKVSGLRLEDPCAYTQMGIATDEATLSCSRLLRRGLFGTDKESYVMDLHGKVRSKLVGISEEGKSEFQIGLLFDGLNGRLKFFQQDKPHQDWAFVDIPLDKTWYVVFGTLYENYCQPTVEICKNLTPPQTLTDAAAYALFGTTLPNYLPVSLKQTCDLWWEHMPSFTKDMKREPFINKYKSGQWT